MLPAVESSFGFVESVDEPLQLAAFGHDDSTRPTLDMPSDASSSHLVDIPWNSMQLVCIGHIERFPTEVP